jgi:hypothetical protein
MLIFPQVSTGASAQYPIARQLSQRSVQSAMEDGTIIALADSSATYLRWMIVLRDLSDQEAKSLTDFFAATQGNLQPFLFLDPTTNLLVWSEDFSQSAWETAGITFDQAVADPCGGSSAARAHNQSAATLSVAQQSQIPGSVQTCFSVYLRADVPATVTLTQSAGNGSRGVPAMVTTTWQRFYVSGMFTGVTAALQFAVTLPAGVSVDLFGPQVDAQVTPSRYVRSTAWSGVCTSARFDGTQIDRIATGPNRNTCVVFIRCNLPVGE